MALKTIIEEDLAHFASVPWTSSLLSQPDTKTFTPPSRLPPDTKGRTAFSQDQFMCRTLSFSSPPPAITHALGLYTDPFLGSSQDFSTRAAPNHGLLIPEITLLWSLSDGAKGFNGTAHGGLLLALMDESIANLFFLNSELYSRFFDSRVPIYAKPAFVRAFTDLSQTAIVTAGLDKVPFVKPVQIPGTVGMACKVTGAEGRKYRVSCEIRGGGDVLYAESEGLMVGVPRKPKPPPVKEGKL